MSLILDALNKAEQDRNDQDKVPTLQASHGPLHTAREPEGIRRWLIEIIFIALLVSGFVVYQLVAGKPEPVMGSSLLPRNSDYPATQTAPIARAPSGNELIAVDRASTGSTTASTEKLTNEEAVAPDPAAIKSLYQNEEQSPELPAIQELPAVETADNILPATDGPAGSADVAIATGATANQDSYWETRPLLNELSRQAKMSIPSIDFSLHVYSAEQGTGFVTLNGVQLREGQQVQAVRVVKITDDFVVLNHDGIEFRLESLNSWVNFESANQSAD